MNAGIIVAAGKGERYGSYKQTEILLHKKVYQYALDVFIGCDLIDAVYLVVHKELYQTIEEDLSTYNTEKQIFLCIGGKSRAESVWHAVSEFADTGAYPPRNFSKYDKVCIHDAARPLITKEDIKNVISNCPENGGCVVGKKIHDTVKKVDRYHGKKTGEIIKSDIFETVNDDSREIWISQTPQAFCLKTLVNCYKGFLDPDEFVWFRDEASILEAHSGSKDATVNPGRQVYDVKILESANTNIKITNKKDFHLAKQLLSNQLTGFGIDFHSLVEGEYLIIGGHKVPSQFSSKAHSDGDVLTHSIIDALLGALNLGDIGEHFPNTPEYLNVSSIELLEKIVKKIPNNKKILHIDSSIVLNEPKISPHKKAIKESLANILKISSDSISIKSTTTNGLTFLDMSTGWGAQTIITIGDDS